jgi:hypothetical protein
MVRMAGYYLVVLDSPRAEVIEVPEGDSPNYTAANHNVLDSYTIRSEAQERCDIENDPVKRGLHAPGKLKVRRTRI